MTTTVSGGTKYQPFRNRLVERAVSKVDENQSAGRVGCFKIRIRNDSQAGICIQVGWIMEKSKSWTSATNICTVV